MAEMDALMLSPAFEPVNYFTQMCSGSEAGSYLRLIDGVYHSTLGLRVIKKKKTGELPAREREREGGRGWERERWRDMYT